MPGLSSPPSRKPISNCANRLPGSSKTLEHQSSASQEKLEVLDRATAQLREAFSSLAAEALRSNNRSFLELAKTSLERFQSEAKGDLEARQRAVEHLVMPIQESLGRVDEKIQQIEKERGQAYSTLTSRFVP